MVNESKLANIFGLYLVGMFFSGYLLGVILGKPDAVLEYLGIRPFTAPSNLWEIVIIVCITPFLMGTMAGGCIGTVIGAVNIPLFYRIFVAFLVLIGTFFFALVGIVLCGLLGDIGSGYPGRGARPKEKGLELPMSRFEAECYRKGYSDYKKYLTEKPPERELPSDLFERGKREAYLKGWEDAKKGKPPKKE